MSANSPSLPPILLLKLWSTPCWPPSTSSSIPPTAHIHASEQSQEVQLSLYPCVDRVGIHSSWSQVKHLCLIQQSLSGLGTGIGVWTRQDGSEGCWDFLSSCANWLLRLFLPWASQNKLRQICWVIAASRPLCWHQGGEGWGIQSPGMLPSRFSTWRRLFTHPWEQGGSWRAAVSVHWWVSGRASVWELQSRVSSLIPSLLWGKDELGEAASKSVVEREAGAAHWCFWFWGLHSSIFLQLSGACAGKS